MPISRSTPNARIAQCILYLALFGLLIAVSQIVWSQLTRDSRIKFTDSLFINIQNTYDSSASSRVKQWQQLINDTTDLPIEEQLYRVNEFFNRIPFVDDYQAWGKEDYWATPFEFLGINAGDCEDFTIAKYITLRELGINDEHLRLMYVTTRKPRQAHMVLAFYAEPSVIPLVLDNINKRILPADRRSDLIPIYSFNGEGLWLAKEQGQGRKIQKTSNNKLWDDLHKRMLQRVK